MNRKSKNLDNCNLVTLFFSSLIVLIDLKLFSSNNLKHNIETACERFKELLLLLVSIVKIISDKFKSSLDNPEFSGPKRIADFLFEIIFFLIN